MPEKLNVFVMWQGSLGPQAVEFLRTDFDGRWKRKLKSSARPDHWQLDFRDVGEAVDFGEGILERTLHLIRQCDCAVALHMLGTLRMVAQLAHLLHQLALRACELRNAKPSARTPKMEALRATLKAVTVFENSVLCRKDDDEFGMPWTRLTDFLQRRFHDFQPSGGRDADLVTTAVGRLEKLAMQFMDKKIYNDLFFKGQGRNRELLGTLDLLTADAELLADCVAELHNAWLEQTQTFIDDRVSKTPSLMPSIPVPQDNVSRDLVGMAIMLGDMSGQFPHNLEGGRKVPIWPQTP